MYTYDGLVVRFSLARCSLFHSSLYPSLPPPNQHKKHRSFLRLRPTPAVDCRCLPPLCQLAADTPCFCCYLYPLLLLLLQLISTCYSRLFLLHALGAGDCFTATYAVAVLEGRTASQALQFASAAASICVTRKGAMPSLPSREEVEQLLAVQ